MNQQKEWVLVTGGSRGIGRGLVKLLAAEGYFVLFTYKSDAISANELVEHVITNGGEAKAFQCDSSQYNNVEKLCSHLFDNYGVPYGLVNNVGITGDQLIFNFDIEKYHDVIATNLNSSIYFNKFFIPAMAENKRGKVIHISSVSGIKGNKGQTSYAATKAAMIGITKTLALEAAR
jgi:3-oxoacyl-[acyl-carrier protein] reductase